MISATIIQMYLSVDPYISTGLYYYCEKCTIAESVVKQRLAKECLFFSLGSCSAENEK
jgi:hypothetical protein